MPHGEEKDLPKTQVRDVLRICAGSGASLTSSNDALTHG